MAPEEWSSRISAIIRNKFYEKDIHELTKFLHACNKIFQCDIASYVLETSWVYYVALLLAGSMDTAWEQHLKAEDPALTTWEGFKKFLAN